MFEVTPITKLSKNGKEYTCLEIKFPNGYTKIVFLDKAEEYLVNSL